MSDLTKESLLKAVIVIVVVGFVIFLISGCGVRVTPPSINIDSPIQWEEPRRGAKYQSGRERKMDRRSKKVVVHHHYRLIPEGAMEE